jgi:hypothetical protein
LENANLIANASGQSFDTIAARHQSGEGWGKIAQDYGFKLGPLVSAAHRSSQATLHAHNTVHGKSATHVRNEHSHASQNFVRGRGTTQKANHGSDQRQGGKGSSHK